LFLGDVEVSFKFMCVHYHEHIVIDGFPMGQWVRYKHNKEGLLLIIETNQNHRVEEIFFNNRKKLVRMVKLLTTLKNLDFKKR
jgi:hypothetical protein